MKSITIYEKWDVILVPFLFADLSAFKKRPALIISPNNYNQYGNVTIIYMTSQTGQSVLPGDYIIEEWRQANLPKPTKIRMRFATIDKRLVIKKIGTLHPSDQSLFRKKLIEFLTSQD